MEIELLGPPGLRVAEGERPRVAGLQQALLAVLALHAPRPVSADALVEVIWGEDLPADPANALQQRISSLRKLVGADLLVTASTGYALRVGDEAIDARRFARRAARGAELLATGDARGARDELDAALELWRGEALDGFADEPWARPDVQRLTELRLTAEEDRNDARLALGAGAELVGELAERVTRHPLRERPAGQLMVALYRDGRQADALEVHDALRRRLVEELGVDPGPAVQSIYRRVLDQDPALDVDTRAMDGRAPGRDERDVAGHDDAARPAPPDPERAGGKVNTRVDNLPAATTTVVGRDEDLGKVGELLAASRVVTITGPGGTGKTTLAVEVARRQPRPVHGTWLVELAPLTGADAVVGSVASVLGVAGGGFGASGADLDRLIAALADQHLLLVLDNAEHVADDLVELLQPLLAAAPEVRILATSREPLGLPGEQVWPLPPLDVPASDETDPAAITTNPAVGLLVARAQQHDPWFTLASDDAPAAARIVRHLDGIPLAIELAAAQLRTVPLHELATGLADRLSILTNPVRGAPERQRTLRGALDWSWELLDPDQRTAWAALSVPAGRFDATTAERLLAVAGAKLHHLVAIRELVERSLLVAETATGRYRMLETIRLYGAEQLSSLGLEEAVRSAHADLVEAGLASCHTSDEPARFGVDLVGLRAWLDDARAVLSWSETVDDRARLQRVAGQLGWLWLLGGLASEGRSWLDRALGPADELDTEVADPTAVLWASGLRASGAQVDDPRWADLAVRLADRPDDRVLAHVYAAVQRAKEGRLDELEEQLRTARSAAEAIGGWPLGFCLLITAQLGRLLGRFEEVGANAAAAQELLSDPDAAWARAYAIDILIDAVLTSPGDADERFGRARELAADGLALCAGAGLPELEARLRLQLGRALHALGDVERGRRHLDDAVRLAATGGPGVGLGFALLTAGTAARQRGELGTAGAQLGEALELLERSGMPFGATEANIELGFVALATDQQVRLGEHARRALALAHGMGDPAALARALELTAVAVAGVSEPATDVFPSLAAASLLRDRADIPLDPGDVLDRGAVEERVAQVLCADVAAEVARARVTAGRDLDAVIAELVASHGVDAPDRSVTGR